MINFLLGIGALLWYIGLGGVSPSSLALSAAFPPLSSSFSFLFCRPRLPSTGQGNTTHNRTTAFKPIMSGNSTANGTDSGIPELPDSLNLPPHLSAQKYFFVCTLTVAAWDTLVLSPRSYRLLRSKGWPLLKIAFHFLRVFMPVEFTIVGVAFFDTKWSLDVSFYPSHNLFLS